MSMNEKQTWGGKRQGSGRKSKNYTERIQIEVTLEMKEKIKETAENKNMNQSDFLRELIERGIE